MARRIIAARGWGAVAVAVVFGWALVGVGPRGPVEVAFAQDKADEKAPPKLDWYYSPVQSCGKCHVEGTKFTSPNPELTRMDQNTLWEHGEKGDKHQQAYLVLSDPAGKLDARAKQMSKILGYDVAKADQCLSCHAPGADLAAKEQVAAETKKPVKDVTAKEVQEKLKSLLGPAKEGEEAPDYGKISQSDGVGCAVCHGTYEPWVTAHFTDALGLPGGKGKGWRQMSSDYKESHYGMRDLRNPATRAELCLSCHVGNPQMGRVVTHEMYAAGHPPLPSIEIATFTGKNMPRHWWLLRDTPFVTKGKTDLQAKYRYTHGLLEEARTVAVSGAIALRETAELLRAQAEEALTPNGPGAMDLASFNCYSCHHDLRVPSWRQERGYAGHVPGRPPMSEWQTALMPLALAQAGGDDGTKKAGDYQKHIGALRAAVTAQPYGDAKKVIAAADALIEWIGTASGKGLLAEMAGQSYDDTSAKRMLGVLTRQMTQTTPDYDSCRQLLWAYRVIYEELKAAEKIKPDTTIDNLLKGFTTNMKLDLKEGRGAISPLKEADSDLGKTLGVLNDYNGIKFKKDAAALAEATAKLIGGPMASGR